MRVCVIDTTAGLLSLAWFVGSAFLGRFDAVIRVRSWDEAYAELGKISARDDILQLQVWGHGQSGAPLINGQAVGLYSLRYAVRPRRATQVWFRSCDVAKGVRGRDWMAEAVRVLGCTVVAHCEVISAPNPLRQGKICALRPGEDPWWALDGEGLRAVSTFRMDVPPWAFRDDQ